VSGLIGGVRSRLTSPCSFATALSQLAGPIARGRRILCLFCISGDVFAEEEIRCLAGRLGCFCSLYPSFIA
jgi:hypothetical protein